MWGFTVRGSWRPNINCNILTPLLWPSALCLSRSPALLNRRPWGPALCWIMAFFTASYQQLLNRGPRAPSAWCGFPYHISSITPSPTLTGTLTSVLTELYNSSTFTQSPSWFLESHVGSSSSRNNCHAVHRSLSSGASVYECILGIFYLVPFHQPISAHAISSHNCH